MPWCLAKASAFPNVGEATPTNLASAHDFNASAWIAEINPEPIKPIPTFSLISPALHLEIADDPYSAFVMALLTWGQVVKRKPMRQRLKIEQPQQFADNVYVRAKGRNVFRSGLGRSI